MAHLFKGLERIEESRERLTGRSFMAGLFVGRPDFSLLLPPEESPEQQAIWEDYRPRLETFLKTHVDPDEIERTAKIPDSVLKGLFALGAFGMKIPTEYGGLGFSYTNYGRAPMLITRMINLHGLTGAVPHTLGIPMPLLLFATIAVGLLLVPRMFGMGASPWSEWVGSVTGMAVGWFTGRAT